MTMSAFDVLALDRGDLRKLPLHLRKTNLARLMARRPEGIFVSDFELGQIGPDLFRLFRRRADTFLWYDDRFRARVGLSNGHLPIIAELSVETGGDQPSRSGLRTSIAHTLR
jgi:hypothetical protein